MDHIQNSKIYERACESVAGGLLTNFKKEKGSQPVYVDHVEGCKIFDFDGNTYYDFELTFGPAILGQSNERLKQAMKDQIDKFYTCQFGMIHLKVAEKIKACVPGLELLRFGVTGSEADYQAIRVARAYTHKNMYVKFNGMFHGGPDYVIGGIVNDPAYPVAHHGERQEDMFSQMCTTQGRARHALDDCFMIEFNDLGAMRELFEKYGDDIAAVIMEPVAINMTGYTAEPEYIKGVRKLCDQHNVVLIYDEIITGFRFSLGGCAELYGVQPDLWTFSKALTGGMPGSVYGGKRKIMDTITDTDVLAAGTFNGHPITMAAMLSVLEQLEENDCEIFKRINKLSDMLKEGFLEKAKKHGIPMIIQGIPGAVVPVFTKKKKIINHRDALQNASIDTSLLFGILMKKHGILNNFRYCIGAAQTEEDIKHIIEVADDVFAEMVQIMQTQSAR
jgi:glutamate-1-semialdehyde 2,1-aminomutase